MRIAIAGCGIAGVSTAIALSGRGHEISVFERAPEPREVGAGIQLSPNAMRHLERWGVGERLARVAVENQAIEIFDGRSARRLVSIPLGERARARYGAPYLLVHRADLLAALLEEAATRPDIRIAFGAPITGARTDGDLARFSAGDTEETADLLVAADGIHSAIRTTAMHLPGPRLFGRVAWRAGVPIAEIPRGIRPDATGLHFARGAHIVHYPVSAGKALNVVLIAEHASELAGIPHAGLSGPAGELLRLIGDTWTLWPLAHLAIPRTWSLGRIVLTGDAAHAMSPSAAQGGAQAIEDAAALAAALDHFTTLPDALAGFAHARRPRVARIAREARINMAVYDLKGPAALARNLAISALSPRIHLSRLDWLYSGGDTKFV